MQDELVEAIGAYVQDKQGDYAHKSICETVGELGGGVLSVIKANGFAVVPVEPTEAMIDAVDDVPEWCNQCGYPKPVRAYAAMLTAAQEPGEGRG